MTLTPPEVVTRQGSGPTRSNGHRTDGPGLHRRNESASFVPSSGPASRADEELRDYIYTLSEGRVVDLRPSGPVFGRLRSRRNASRRILRRALTSRQRLLVAALSGSWVITFAVFAIWWLYPTHRLGWLAFVANSALLILTLGLSMYFLTVVNRMRRVDPRIPLPEGLRVAMVVTKAPSEPWELVRVTLEAMLEQDYPDRYDVWLADEDPSAQVTSWCSDNGVRVSTRRGDERYQRPTWPRRRRCKEGNLAYFYDHYGYAMYDVVAQLDADHVPSRDYLREMVRPFSDASVGYVAAPSICDANADTSWTVRGRPHEESTFHGAQQLGLSAVGSPVCIGSHYTVRTDALRQIGGLGPDLAEDFSTTYLLNVAGWRGVFAIDADAHGDGPRDFGAMVTQEFQWSRSLTTIWFGLVLRTFRRLPLGLGIRFLFMSGADMIFSILLVGGISLFLVANVTHQPWVAVSVVWFFALWSALKAWLLVLTFVLRRARLLRPIDPPIISWERALYNATRYPFILIGAVVAIAGMVVPGTLDFKVTPKGDAGPDSLPLRLILPFCVIAGIHAVGAFWGFGHMVVIGYVGLSLLAALSQVGVGTLVVLLHAADNRRRFGLTRVGALQLVDRPLALCSATALPVLWLSASYIAALLEIY